MVDCCRSYDADYAIRMLRMVEEFNLTWLEEPVQLHDHAGYVKVRAEASMPISGGENEYSKHAFRCWAELEMRIAIHESQRHGNRRIDFPVQNRDLSVWAR